MLIRKRNYGNCVYKGKWDLDKRVLKFTPNLGPKFEKPADTDPFEMTFHEGGAVEFRGSADDNVGPQLMLKIRTVEQTAPVREQKIDLKAALLEPAMFDDVRDGNIHKVNKFLNNGGNVNAQDDPGYTPLHWAVNEDFKGSHREMVRLLISAGADVNATDDLQETPLHFASNRVTAKILIDNGGNVNSKSRDGKTLLFSATMCAANARPKTFDMYLDLVKLLIENDADLNTKDESGETPLHLIAGSFNEKSASKICELLLSNGANVNLTNNAGHTPLDIAVREKRIETAKLLRKFGGKTSEDQHAKKN